MLEEYIVIEVKYGCGYGVHDTEVYVAPDATDEEIEDAVQEHVQEQFWWSHTKQEN